MQLDRRLHAFRPDLADARLKGRIDAANYAEPVAMQIVAEAAPVRKAPAETAMQETQALAGETLHAFEQKNGWLWAQLARDGYVGYIDARHARGPIEAATHRIAVPLTLSFPEADIKSTPVQSLPLNAEVTGIGEAGKFLKLSDRRFIIASHAAALPSKAEDFVAVAESYCGVPYLWGGKTFRGLDCSGLVQISLHAVGIASPRDADMQENALGKKIPHETLRRGDLVFWKGHVGIMTDAETLLHANGHHMMTVMEPLAQAIARIAATGSEVTSIRRIQ
jgi:cell wall-associated NlpC family hydrolase